MKKVVAALSVFVCTSSAWAFMPQAGTWIVSSENTGQPGRGFGLDVQNNTLVMQMYGYEANGAPTFYLSAGTISNNTYTGQLNQYAGGQSFGSAQHAGRETGSAGTVTMRFVSGTKGFITFPGEAEKEIERFTFAYPETPESLLGSWGIITADPATGEPGMMMGALTRVVDGAAYSANNAMACRYTGVSKGEVWCAFQTNGTITFNAKFTLSVNDGEGWGGKGASGNTWPINARRLTTPGGQPVGIKIPNKSAEMD